MTSSTSQSSKGLTSRCSRNHLYITVKQLYLSERIKGRWSWLSQKETALICSLQICKLILQICKITYLWSWLLHREKWTTVKFLGDFLKVFQKIPGPSIQSSQETISEISKKCHWYVPVPSFHPKNPQSGFIPALPNPNKIWRNSFPF